MYAYTDSVVLVGEVESQVGGGRYRSVGSYQLASGMVIVYRLPNDKVSLMRSNKTNTFLIEVSQSQCKSAQSYYY